MMTEIPFHKQMRNATKEIHALSDALVNAKLAFALSDNNVWAEGLLVFYEVFRFLEDAMIRLENSHLGTLGGIDGIQRTVAFEKDLTFYLGSDWNKNYIPRESVAKYLIHLQKLEQDDPIRLIAYVYHLYMGLLSGGQILSKKRKVIGSFSFISKSNTEGYAVTDFGDKKIYALKKKIIDSVNGIAEELNANERESIIDESKIVFELNNSIIKSVKGATHVILKKLSFYIVLIIIFVYIYKKVIS